MAELVADAALFPIGNAPTGILRSAVSVSILLHAVLIGGVSVALSWPKNLDDAGVEAISVDIVTLDEFTSSTTVAEVQSSATETMQSAGAQSVAAIEATPVEEPPVQTAVPIAKAVVEVTETPRAMQINATTVAPVTEAMTSTEPLPPAAASETPSVETVAPLTADLAETSVAVAVPSDPVAVASVQPSLSEAIPVESALPPVANVVATSITAVASAEAVQPNTERVASVEPDTVEPLPEPEPKVDKAEKPAEKVVEKPAEKPVEKPNKEPKPKKKQAAAGGNGGKSDADAAAANSTASGKGKTGTAGSAAVDKYPGIVQRQLRRALRFPKGAGRARGEVHVQFVVSASGGTSHISVVRSSGEALIDQAAIATVERAAPFPPIPSEAGRSSWTFTIPLRFAR